VNEDEVVRLRSLAGGERWDKREEAVKGGKRWRRVVVKQGWEGDELTEMEVSEGIPLPKLFKLGLEEKGVHLNNSDRPVNNFGVGKNPLFPIVGGGGEEGKNWIASFTRQGCVGCVSEDGERMHKGRNGDPVVLVIGDEACPMTVGRTIEVGKSGCCWVFKREHLGLEEVGEVVRKINAGKREADKRVGRRQFDFFLPRGSKILVGSYVHLRMVGLEEYIVDFNKMVRDVWGVTGDNGVEVLPFVPVIMDEMDERGRELIAGLRDWIGWVGRRTERGAVRALAGTGGTEKEGMVSGSIQYVPTFLTQKDKVSGGVGAGAQGRGGGSMEGERAANGEWGEEGTRGEEGAARKGVR